MVEGRCRIASVRFRPIADTSALRLHAYVGLLAGSTLHKLNPDVASGGWMSYRTNGSAYSVIWPSSGNTVNGNLSATLCLLLLSAIGVLPAAASDWEKIGVDDDGRTWFVDKATVNRVGDIVRAWRKVELAKPDPYPPTGQLVSTAVFLEVTDCSRSLTGVKESKLLSADGSIIATHEDPDEKIQWQAAAGGSFLEGSIRYICASASEIAP